VHPNELFDAHAGRVAASDCYYGSQQACAPLIITLEALDESGRVQEDLHRCVQVALSAWVFEAPR
jgi:hypothetical protein